MKLNPNVYKQAAKEVLKDHNKEGFAYSCNKIKHIEFYKYGYNTIYTKKPKGRIKEFVGAGYYPHLKQYTYLFGPNET